MADVTTDVIAKVGGYGRWLSRVGSECCLLLLLEVYVRGVLGACACESFPCSSIFVAAILPNAVELSSYGKGGCSNTPYRIHELTG
jgi:hypothetical protein